MGGAQPLAVTMNGGVALCVDVDPARIERRIKTRYLDRETDDLDDALAWAERGEVERGGRLDRPAGQLRRGRARAPAPRVAARHRHRPDERARSARRLRPGRAHAGGCGGLRARIPRIPAPAYALDGRARRRDGRVPGRRRRRVRLREQPAAGAELGGLRARSRVRLPGVRAGVRAPAVLRGQGPVPLGGALGRSRGHRQDRPRGRRAVPGRRTAAAVARMAGERVAFQGLPARICWLGYGERAKAGCASTRWSRRASCPRRS